MGEPCGFRRYSMKLSKLLDTMADACIRDEFGIGQQRVNNLKSLGFSMAQIREIQRRINKKMAHRNKDIK